MKLKSDQELLQEYHRIKNGGIKSFASWWGLNLIVRELKNRDIYEDLKLKTGEK